MNLCSPNGFWFRKHENHVRCNRYVISIDGEKVNRCAMPITSSIHSVRIWIWSPHTHKCTHFSHEHCKWMNVYCLGSWLTLRRRENTFVECISCNNNFTIRLRRLRASNMRKVTKINNKHDSWIHEYPAVAHTHTPIHRAQPKWNGNTLVAVCNFA